MVLSFARVRWAAPLCWRRNPITDHRQRGIDAAPHQTRTEKAKDASRAGSVNDEAAKRYKGPTNESYGAGTNRLSLNDPPLTAAPRKKLPVTPASSLSSILPRRKTRLVSPRGLPKQQTEAKQGSSASCPATATINCSKPRAVREVHTRLDWRAVRIEQTAAALVKAADSTDPSRTEARLSYNRRCCSPRRSTPCSRPEKHHSRNNRSFHRVL